MAPWLDLEWRGKSVLFLSLSKYSEQKTQGTCFKEPLISAYG